MRLSFYSWLAKRWSQQCYSGHLHVLAPWDLSCRWCILRQDQDISGVPSTLSLWKICSVNTWCALEFLTIWKCVHIMNLNIIKYLAIIWMYSCEYYYVNLNPVWIWIMYEFKFEIFKYSCNLYLSNSVDWLKLADTKDNLPHPMQTIFGVGYVKTVDTKNQSLVSVDISRHKK
jgi:hypothetical protein